SLLQLAQVKAGAQETDILRAYRSHVTRRGQLYEANPSHETAEPLTEAITAVESLEQVLADRRQENYVDYHAYQMEASTSAFFSSTFSGVKVDRGN
ncbi:hypothetical protein L916_03234, partial [Phytophthora nicotianae]